MFEREKPSTWMRVLISLVLVAVVIGGGYAIYRLGFAQGVVTSDGGEVILDNWTAHPMMNSNFYPHARSFYPRGNLFFGLIFVLLLFSFFRRMMFGPHWSRWGYGPRGFHGHPGHPGYDDCGPERKSKQSGEKVPVVEDKPE